MKQTLTQAETEKCSALYQKGIRLTEGRIVVDGAGSFGPPGWFTRWQLRRAEECFLQVVKVAPDEWVSLFMIGKIHQRLGDHTKSFEWLLRAHQLQPDKTPLAKEVGKEALMLGRFPEAVAAAEAAVRSKPDEPELLSNLALAYCFVGKDQQADLCAKKAVDNDPEDRISAMVLALVRAVASGARPRPKTFSDLQSRG